MFTESGIGTYVRYSIIKKKLIFILRVPRPTQGRRADDDDNDDDDVDVCFVYKKILEF